jgi:DNA repair protein RecO (recombination protein O)
MLHHSICEEEKNEPLFHFIESALHWFDHHDEIANFHLIFLLEITKYLGFYPDITESQLPYFEMKEGIFAPFHSLTSLSENDSKLFKKLIDLKFENSQKTFHVSERQIVLKILIDYYSMHLDGFKKPKSLEVLKEVFSS